MSQNTRSNSMVIGKSESKRSLKATPAPDVGLASPPESIESSTAVKIAAAHSSHQPQKLTRAEKRKQNQILQQRIQVEEIAKADTPRVKIQIIPATGEGEHLPAISNMGGKGGRAKAVTAVQSTQMGRPSEYTEAEADAICAWIAAGHSLTSYCKQAHRDHVTIYRWLRERADFHARYSQAHEDRADTLVDEMVAIADEAQLLNSMEGVTAARLRVDTRKWIASKMKSSKYGEKVEVKQTGAVNIRIGLTAPAHVPLVEDITPDVQRINNQDQM